MPNNFSSVVQGCDGGALRLFGNSHIISFDSGYYHCVRKEVSAFYVSALIPPTRFNQQFSISIQKLFDIKWRRPTGLV